MSRSSAWIWMVGPPVFAALAAEGGTLGAWLATAAFGPAYSQAGYGVGQATPLVVAALIVTFILRAQLRNKRPQIRTKP